ncbi:MAG: hypothetical protein HQ519_07505 [Planctomycetes bacterium]|nr:hypothetical protein [Planctomycetota bacterium]
MTLLADESQFELIQQLLQKPAAAEPGLLLRAEPITMRSGNRIDLHGIDLLGRPCLFGMFLELDAQAYDWLLEVITSFRDGLEGADPIYQRGREPRLFVLSHALRLEDYSRLRFFAESISIRAFRIAKLTTSWQLRLAYPEPEPVLSQPWLECIEEKDRDFVQRMLAAAGRGGVKIALQGGPWPMNLVNSEGPFASLHSSESGLLMSVPTQDEKYTILDLNLPLDRDLAIDSVLRHRRTEEISL